MTTIEWTRNDDGTAGRTWNPTTGCDRVSAGCDNCYALTMANRLKAMGNPKYLRDGDPRTSGPGFGLTVHPDVVSAPLHWRKPTRVFVNSMSDLFHDSVPVEWLAEVFAVMAATPQHTYQLLTKRHARLRSVLNSQDFALDVASRAIGKGAVGVAWPLPNLWVGVSAEDQKWADIRIPALLDTPAAVRWVSAEPLLGPIRFQFLHYFGQEPGEHWGLNWVVLGGESGPGARPMQPEWAQRIVDDCRTAGVPVFVKQIGTVLGGKAHHDIDAFPAGKPQADSPRYRQLGNSVAVPVVRWVAHRIVAVDGARSFEVAS